jgi:UDP-N-acetylmuramate dehydrogenase
MESGHRHFGSIAVGAMGHDGETASKAGERGTQPVSTAALRRVMVGVRGRSLFHEPLQNYTSFKIGGPADVLVAIREEPGHVLYAEGGVGMPTLIGYAVRRGLSGVEWGAGIPGTVSGCVVMNAGTRLGEMKDSVKTVRLVTPKGNVTDIDASDIEFEYRRARLPRGVVVAVRLQLRAGVRATIEKTVKEYLQYRKDTQPLALPSAGCVFRNPPRDSAGRLVEAAGLKGARVGDAQVSDKHANFMVNVGHARAKDVLDLIKKVRREVRRKTGVSLDLELKIVGEA